MNSKHMTINHMVKTVCRGGIAVAALALAGLTPAVAQAGFEWKPPARDAAPARAGVPAMPPAPATPVERSVLPSAPAAATMPVTDEQAVQAAMNEGAPTDPWFAPPPVGNADPMDRHPLPPPAHGFMPRGPEAAPQPVPVIRRAEPVQQESLAAHNFMKAGTTSFPDTVGFGRDIPLALALQQIVPAGHAFAFGNGAHAGVRVSWEGGRPWNNVLADALAPHGLAAQITGNNVLIRSASAMSAASYAPVSYAAPDHGYHPPLSVESAPAHAWQGHGQGTEDYAPSYPRRDPAAARERMMNDAAERARNEEPAAYDPHMMGQPPQSGDSTPGAPMPLMVEQKPQGKGYTQLTGLNGDMPPRRLDAQDIRYWQAHAGESLRSVMANWAEQAGVQLFWADGPDYSLPAPLQMHGNFQTAITRLLESFGGAQPHPVGQLHPNLPTGPAVLIIDHS